MPLATHTSLVLARFEQIRDTGTVSEVWPSGTLFWRAGADVRAGNSSAKEQRAFKFVLLGLHESEASAREAVAGRNAAAPWLADAMETFAAVLQPFRHYGEANFVEQEAPGPLFEVSEATPDEDTPIVILTSVGWSRYDEEAIARIKRFSEGVAAVRIGMTGLPGLHSQQTFSFPGGLEWDGLTVTFWRDLASAMAFAYGPGFHRSQVKLQREGPYGDRTSFTRFVALHREGTWHGSDPFD